MSYVVTILFFFCIPISCFCQVTLGIDRIFSAPYTKLLEGKKVGLITNQTGVTTKLETTIELFSKNQKAFNYDLVALFGPEHGINGDAYAFAHVASKTKNTPIPIYSLHGDTRRPTDAMLSKVTLLVFDIQDIGSRPYTYISTLFYCMEEAAKKKIPLIVLDRPNPINGFTIDGPMLEPELRSFIGYINIPYCHGMTIGELARLFNGQYGIGCKLEVVPMKGWTRSMSYLDTKLSWIPTSPNVPEASTCLLYPATGMLGEMSLCSIGIGYTLPFKVVGAPWISGQNFAKTLNSYQIPGVYFHPTRFRPFAMLFQGQECQGVLLTITDKQKFLPVTTQYALLSALKELYPEKMDEALKRLKKIPKTFFKACGTYAIANIVAQEKKPFDTLKKIHSKEREAFKIVRKKYLLKEYE